MAHFWVFVVCGCLFGGYCADALPIWTTESIIISKLSSSTPDGSTASDTQHTSLSFDVELSTEKTLTDLSTHTVVSDLVSEHTSGERKLSTHVTSLLRESDLYTEAGDKSVRGKREASGSPPASSSEPTVTGQADPQVDNDQLRQLKPFVEDMKLKAKTGFTHQCDNEYVKITIDEGTCQGLADFVINYTPFGQYPALANITIISGVSKLDNLRNNLNLLLAATLNFRQGVNVTYNEEERNHCRNRPEDCDTYRICQDCDPSDTECLTYCQTRTNLLQANGTLNEFSVQLESKMNDMGIDITAESTTVTVNDGLGVDEVPVYTLGTFHRLVQHTNVTLAAIETLASLS